MFNRCCYLRLSCAIVANRDGLMVSGDRTLWSANQYKNQAFPIRIRIPSFLPPTIISTTTTPSPLSAYLLILRLLTFTWTGRHRLGPST
jgi:hypothetical protein